MARDSVKDTKKEIQKENNEFYGEETTGGHQAGLDSDNDAGAPLSKLVGARAKEKIKKHEPFVLGE